MGFTTDLLPEVYRHAFEFGTEPMWAVDKQCRLLGMNKKARDYFYQFSALRIEAGTNMLLVMPAVAKELWQSLYNKALLGESVSQTSAYDMQGNTIYYTVVLEPIRNNAGEIAGCLATTLSDGERLNQPDVVEESQFRLKHAIENSEDGLFDWDMVTDEVFYSKRWKAMLGYEEEDLDNNISAWRKLVHPDDLPPVLLAIEDHVSGRTEQYHISFRLRHKDGKYRWVLSRGKAVDPGPDGRPRRFIGTQIDIDQEKKQAELQHKHEVLLRGLLEASTRILQEIDLSVSLPEALGKIGNASRAHRILLFKFLDNQQCMCRYRWEEGQGATEIKWSLENENIEQYKVPVRWYEVLTRGDVLYGPTTRFPEDEQSLLEGYGVKSVLMVPIFTATTPWGYMVFDDLKEDADWYEPNVDVLRNFALSVGHAKQRQYFQEDMLELQRNLLEAQSIAKMGSFEFNFALNKAFWSDEIKALYELPPDVVVEAELLNSMMHRDDQPRRKNIWREAVLQKKPYDMEFRVKLASGKMRYMRAKGGPVLDGHGQLARMVGTIQDITDQRASEQKIQQFVTMIEYSHDFIALTNLEGYYFYMNPEAAAVLGIPGPADAIGRNYKEFGDDRLTGIVDEVITPAILESGSWEGEISLRHPQKGERVMLSSFFLIYDTRFKTPTAIAIFQRDITDRKNSEIAALEHSREVESINQELDNFAYIISHDLKAPLRAIQNLTTWIAEDLQELMTEETAANMELLKGRVNRMSGMIDGVLSYSRAGRFKSDPQSMDLSREIKDIWDSLPNKKRKLTVEGEPLPTLLTEKVALSQVFSNLLGNALRYGKQDEQAEVRISCKRTDDFYCFGVHDNGPGIPAGYQESIFRLFQTIDTKKHEDSTGIGLSIVKKIVEDQGGAVWIDQTPPTGAHFYFTWPAK